MDAALGASRHEHTGSGKGRAGHGRRLPHPVDPSRDAERQKRSAAAGGGTGGHRVRLADRKSHRGEQQSAQCNHEQERARQSELGQRLQVERVRVADVVGPVLVAVPHELIRARPNTCDRVATESLQSRMPQLAAFAAQAREPLRRVSGRPGGPSGAVEAVPCLVCERGPDRDCRQQRDGAERREGGSGRTRLDPHAFYAGQRGQIRRDGAPGESNRNGERNRTRPLVARGLGDLWIRADRDDDDRRSSGGDERVQSRQPAVTRQRDDGQHRDGRADGAGSRVGQITNRDRDAHSSQGERSPLPAWGVGSPRERKADRHRGPRAERIPVVERVVQAPRVVARPLQFAAQTGQ